MREGDVALAAGLTLILGFSATSRAAEPPAAVVSCPDSLVVSQVAKAPSPEWTVSYSSLPVDLEAVTLFDGPPEERASLIYDETSEAGEEWTATWKLAANPRGTWVRCSYRGTTAELSRKLASSVMVCRATYEKAEKWPSGLPVIRLFECR
jgi:hypothetical protein